MAKRKAILRLWHRDYKKIREANNSTASITQRKLFDENSMSQNATRNTQENVFDENSNTPKC